MRAARLSTIHHSVTTDVNTTVCVGGGWTTEEVLTGLQWWLPDVTSREPDQGSGPMSDVQAGQG